MVAADYGDRLHRGDAGSSAGRHSNFLLTFRGRYERIYRSPAVFILVGVWGYLLGSAQDTFEAFRSLQQLWHLINYTVGHSHLTMYGFVTFAIWSGAYALLPRATGKYPCNLAMGIHFWLSAIGVAIYVAALSAAGTIQGLRIRGLTFVQSVAIVGNGHPVQERLRRSATDIAGETLVLFETL